MPGDTKSHSSTRASWIELLVLIVVAVVIAIGVRTFVVQTFWIPSASMEHTLRVDDKVLVNKMVYKLRDPARGEVIVFEPPVAWGVDPSKKEFIKRIVAVGGDRVVCCGAGNRLTVNGTLLDEDYVYPGDKPSETTFDVTVPAGQVFVLGDHRSASADSRYHLDHQNGTVPVDRVVGRAFVLIWPLSRATVLSPPPTFTGACAGSCRNPDSTVSPQ